MINFVCFVWIHAAGDGLQDAVALIDRMPSYRLLRLSKSPVTEEVEQEIIGTKLKVANPCERQVYETVYEFSRLPDATVAAVVKYLDPRTRSWDSSDAERDRRAVLILKAMYEPEATGPFKVDDWIHPWTLSNGKLSLRPATAISKEFGGYTESWQLYEHIVRNKLARRSFDNVNSVGLFVRSTETRNLQLAGTIL